MNIRQFIVIADFFIYIFMKTAIKNKLLEALKFKIVLYCNAFYVLVRNYINTKFYTYMSIIIINFI